MARSLIRVVLSSTALFGVMSLLPKALAIAKDMMVAARFGATQTLDVYLMAFVLIGVPVSVVVVAIQTTLIPALVEKDAGLAARLLGGALKLATGLLVLALPFWLLLLPLGLERLYPNSEEGALDALFSACVWLVPFYFINGVNLLLYGALQARKVYWPNALLPGLFPLAILGAVWLSSGASIHSLVIGTVTGSVLEGAALCYVLRRKLMLTLSNTEGSGLMPVMRLALPLMAGGLISSFAPVVEQLIAFTVGQGAVSLLSYGNKVPAAVSSLLLTAIGIVVLPHFAELIAKREWGVCRMLHLRLSGIAFAIGILIAAVGIAFSESMIQLLFERGAFTPADTRETAAVMCVYLLQVPFLLVAMVSMRALVAMGKTLVLTWITTTQLVFACTLAFFFSSRYGVVGVASGTTAAAIIGAGILGAAAWHFFNQRSRNIAT